MIPKHQFTMRRALVELNAQSGSAKKEAATRALYTGIDALKEHYLDMIDTQDVPKDDVANNAEVLAGNFQSKALNKKERETMLLGFLTKAITVDILNYVSNRKRAEAKVQDVEQWPISKEVIDTEASDELDGSVAGAQVLSIYKRTGTPYLKKRLAMEKLQAANHVLHLRDKCRRLGKSRNTSF